MCIWWRLKYFLFKFANVMSSYTPMFLICYLLDYLKRTVCYSILTQFFYRIRTTVFTKVVRPLYFIVLSHRKKSTNSGKSFLGICGSRILVREGRCKFGSLKKILLPQKTRNKTNNSQNLSWFWYFIDIFFSSNNSVLMMKMFPFN